MRGTEREKGEGGEGGGEGGGKGGRVPYGVPVRKEVASESCVAYMGAG